ncbi:AraC family transcriptional regulator [Janthinobacterium agaricidamnosum]|uniref:Bacterial regulatory helix-turn-helix s, AraC family protein n=1 Tax=Janthinobacterium agaricidamnosum NBRC 102515 = DSM 9628 TaxID=1349767 RepID=W0V632_9BURK|nr:AraC family transcriptional regulator [Janthinobacterium agaricidamnosum]CDG84289.1 bacterial regulatory helix-turn-helix s, AraC family protein [Janthinobacterium agaricidamnosum NBRC 102515 = DSM 9628]
MSGGYHQGMEKLTEIGALIQRHAQRWPSRLALDGVRVLASEGVTAPLRHVAEPVFALVAQGAKRTMLGDRVYDYGAGQYLVVSVDLPISGSITRASPAEPFLAVGLTLKPAIIASLLLEMPAGAPRSGLSGLHVSSATPDVLDALLRLLRLADHPADIAVLAPLIEREIHWRLLSGEQGAALRQIGMADSRLSHIGRAISWICTHYAQALRSEDLARLASMSVSSFHRHFRAVTAMSPLQYQKQIRLQQARVQLMREAADVAAVGYSVGYDSPSQFSREYSRLFGAPPGRDVAQLRALGMPPAAII